MGAARQPPTSANGAGAPPGDTTAELLALRAAIEEARRDLNARLDRLAQSVERLLPAGHPPAPAEHPAAPVAPPSAQGRARRTVALGQEVYVPRLGGTFTVVEVAPSGRTFKVQAGTMRVQVRDDEVWDLDGDGTDERRDVSVPFPRAGWPAISTHIPEIDLHGFSEQDALVTLELFLHHAFTQRTPRVRVIHGKGDGILRAAVRREMARSPLVRAIDSGPQFRGDDGVTLAELDV